MRRLQSSKHSSLAASQVGARLTRRQRLFEDGAPPTKFSLATAESYDNGVLYLKLRSQA